MRLAKEEGRLDWSEAHVKLISLINNYLSKGDSAADLDGYRYVKR